MFEPIMIPGAVEHYATPVHPHSTTENMVMQKSVSENTTKDLETAEEEDIPNLMIEIANSLDERANAEPELFAVDGSTDTVEYNMPIEENETEENRDDTNQELPLEIDISGEGE